MLRRPLERGQYTSLAYTDRLDGRRFPSYEHAEHETLHWIGFYNEERLHEELGDLPPAEYEQLNYKRDTIRTLST